MLRDDLQPCSDCKTNHRHEGIPESDAIDAVVPGRERLCKRGRAHVGGVELGNQTLAPRGRYFVKMWSHRTINRPMRAVATRDAARTLKNAFFLEQMAEQPPTSLDPAIRAYYDRASEESRLELGAFRLEELRSRELILRHAPNLPAVVLDVGGAAGAYAFWLAQRGYEVRLLDAVPRLVEIARQRNEHAVRRLAACRVADARALPEPSESAAMMLLLGPLYHLVQENDRQAALSEALRVLRPRGVLIAAGICRWASSLDGLARELLRDREFARIVERDLVDGHHQNPTERLDYFTTAYFHRPEELRHEVIDAGFEVEGLYGIEGPGWILPDLDERWQDQERREMLLQVARLLESEPSVLGCSAHLMVIGRKPRRHQ